MRGLSRRMAWHRCCPIPGSPPGMGKGGMSRTHSAEQALEPSGAHSKAESGTFHG